MIKPTKKNLKESRRWRSKMIVAYRRNQLIKQQIKQLEAIPNWNWEYDIDPAAKKKELLKLAKSGAKRPTSLPRTRLGTVLINYTLKSSTTYDADFDKEIRALRPDWWNAVDKKKKELLKLAENGAPKPNTSTKLGASFYDYVNPSRKMFDPVFSKRIRALRPNWFINDTSRKKEAILVLARSGASKPKRGTKTYDELMRYMAKSRRHVYDADFDKEIRALRPDWFEKSSDKNKEEILALAKNEAPKPKGKLGILLTSYIYQSSDCFDADFNKKIRILCPHWFVRSVDENKKKLLALAKSGAPKPKTSTKLGDNLRRYTGPVNPNRRSSFDPVFSKKIRALRPDWFQTA